MNLPIPENLVIKWPYTERPTDRPPARPRDRPSAPQKNQCVLSHFLTSLGKTFSYQEKTLRKNFERFSCLESSVKKSKHREADLNINLSFKLLRLRIFRNTLILVIVKENCCLCECFTELYFFHWLLVVSLLQFYRYVVCFQSFMNIARRSTQNTARIKRFLRLHIVIKPLNRKLKTTNSLLCWSVTLLLVTANLAFVKSENWLAV